MILEAQFSDTRVRSMSGMSTGMSYRPRWSSTRYWMISSARTRTDCGMVRPRALAVLRLITSSKAQLIDP